MTYKKLVELIAGIKTREQLYETMAKVDRAFDTEEKITFKEHETLYDILGVYSDIFEMKDGHNAVNI